MAIRVALSWSGGKDSCMAYDRLAQDGYEVACLVTTVPREIGRTFGHGERIELIRAQGEALGLPVSFIDCGFETYTDDYVSAVRELRKAYRLDAIAYGDLFLAEHREWGTGVADAAGLEALYPLWMKPEDTEAALRRFVDSGYRAVVIRVRDSVLSADWLGREVDRSFMADIARLPDVCPMGEGGEYHTFVYDGPRFRHPIPLAKGEVLQLETTKRLELALA
ncbi:diphthine--ammonia ligase [Cohnella sp. GCM10027633]|uniref:Dph6-related ATP pyrophosphatase n=1 Tax=unclassified Cohnella TaxID=2636738 RepID=UPI00363D320A